MFQRNRETELDYNSRVTKEIRSAENKYQSLLAETQAVAKSGDRIALRNTLVDLIDFLRTKLFSLAQRVGLSSANDVSDKQVMRAELRTAGLIRRTAMLTAACVYLDQRLANPRLNKTTQKFAKKRSTLSRELPNLNSAITRDEDFQNGQSYEILTRIEDIQFIKRGNKPLSIANCAGLSPGIQVAFKAIWQSGISAGPIWCRAKYKASDSAFEREFEGIKQHAGSAWEDWLADETREAFDLNVENLHAESAIPQLRTRASGLDLVNRLGGI